MWLDFGREEKKEKGREGKGGGRRKVGGSGRERGKEQEREGEREGEK